jgi:signal transduction histidine kinase
MDFDQIKLRTWFSGSLIALLGVLGLVMAVLQYRWTGELSRAEHDRMRDALQLSLFRLSHDFDEELSTAISGLQPNGQEVAENGREGAYLARYSRWTSQNAGSKLFRILALAIPNGTNLDLKQLDPVKRTFEPAEWPARWSGLHEQLLARVRGDRPSMGNATELLVELPRFVRDASGPGTMGEQDWLIVEFDPAYVRDVLLTKQIARHLPTGAEPYQVEVYGSSDTPIYRAGLKDGESLRGRAQASTRLLEVSRPAIMRLGGGPRRGPDGPGFPRGGPRPERGARPGPPPNDSGRGSWQLLVSPPGGSLEALVDRTRWRNLALAITLLALIIATALLLVRSARQAQQLAELQMNFVSSVSHELRTPLTVIRTAAFNLRGRVAAKPDQVERYGKLIQEQSEKLGALVEQVLRYASSRVGQVIHEREAVVIDDVIEGGIRSSQLALDQSPYRLDKKIDPGLPLVLADERALQHVIQNLLDNAVKYGTETSNWIGLTVTRAGEFLEICVADQGPGIPADEQSLVFEPFFRGRRALADQVNGTGLGLNLVKKIVEAHGGTIRVQGHSPTGSEFIVRIPVAPPEMQDEFAHTAG